MGFKDQYGRKVRRGEDDNFRPVRAKGGEKRAPVMTEQEIDLRVAYAYFRADGNRQGLIDAGIIDPGPSPRQNPTFRFRRHTH
jgi:hypothetical protein